MTSIVPSRAPLAARKVRTNRRAVAIIVLTLLGLMALNAGAVSAQPQPPLPLPGFVSGEPDFVADFDRFDDTWIYEESDAFGTAKLKWNRGGMELSLVDSPETDRGVHWRFEVPYDLTGDYFYRLSFQALPGFNVGEFGIGLTDDNGFYSFRVNLTDNTFRLSRYNNADGWSSVSEILDMPAPLTASDRMALGVLVDGSRLEFYINDLLVAETTSVNPNLAEGYTVAPVAQVSADEIIVMRVDDLEVWLLDSGNIDVDI